METDEMGMESTGTLVDILHPEILSKDDLIDLLSQKHIKVDHLHTTKDNLIEIFHRTVTPLPQREPRSNRRGRAIAEVQKKLQAKQNVQSDGNDGSKVTLKIGFSRSRKNAESVQRMSSASSSHGLSRLKPPPIVSSKQRTIRLNSCTSSSAKQSVNSSSAAVTHEKDDLSLTASNNQVSKDNFEPRKTVLDKSPMQMKSGNESTKTTTHTCTSTIQRDFTDKIKLNACGSSGVLSVSDKVRKISLKSSRCGVGSGISKMGIKRTAPIDVNGKTSTTSSDENVKTLSSDEDMSPKKKIKRIAWP